MFDCIRQCSSHLQIMVSQVASDSVAATSVSHGNMRLQPLTDSVRIVIHSQGFYKYRFLDATVCKVTPLLTTVCANYSDDLISSEVISSAPFQPENVEILSFIACWNGQVSVDQLAGAYEQRDWSYSAHHLFFNN